MFCFFIMWFVHFVRSCKLWAWKQMFGRSQVWNHNPTYCDNQNPTTHNLTYKDPGLCCIIWCCVDFSQSAVSWAFHHWVVKYMWEAPCLDGTGTRWQLNPIKRWRLNWLKKDSLSQGAQGRKFRSVKFTSKIIAEKRVKNWESKNLRAVT